MSEDENKRGVKEQVEKLGTAVGIRAGLEVAEVLDNLKHNASMKHAGDLDQLTEFIGRGSTKVDWALSQMAFYDDPFTEAVDDVQNILDNVTSDPQMKLVKVDVRNPRVLNITKGQKQLQFIEMWDEASDTLTISFSGVSEGVGSELITTKLDSLKKTDFTFGKGKVHKTMFELYDNMRTDIMHSIVEHNPGKLKFVGHSMGASLAEIAGADTGLGVKNTTVTSFNPFPIGDAEFSKNYPKINLNRIGNKFDPVMFHFGFMFKHATQKMWDLSYLRQKDMNKSVWTFRNIIMNKGARVNDYIDIVHRAPGIIAGMEHAEYDPVLLENRARKAGDFVFDSKLVKFLETIENNVGATTSDALEALKEVYKISGGNISQFKELIKNKVVKKISEKMTLENVNKSLDEWKEVVNFKSYTELDDIEFLDDLADLDDIKLQTNLDDINIRNVDDVVDTSSLLKGIEKSDVVLGDIRKPVLKGVIKKFGDKSIIKNQIKAVRQIGKRAKGLLGAFGRNGKNIGKAVSALSKAGARAGKGLARAVDFGVLDAVFVVVDTVEDFDRYEDEKEYTMWNGVPIHKTHSPNEYGYLVALKSIYGMMGGKDNLRVDMDQFINTWFGRLDEDEEGNLLLDGEIADLNELSDIKSYGIAELKDDEGVQLQSKAEIVGKNVAKGILSFLVGTAIAVGAAALAPATGGASIVGGAALAVSAGVGIEEADYAIEQAQIAERANNFSQALQKKAMNNEIDALIIRLINLYAPINDHDIMYDKKLLLRAIVNNDAESLRILGERTFPVDLIKDVGKLTRATIKRIDDKKIYDHESMENIVQKITNHFYGITRIGGDGVGRELASRQRLNEWYDQLYEGDVEDINLKINLIYEKVTDQSNLLKKEEIEEIIKEANDLINLDPSIPTRKQRNEVVKEMEENIDDLIVKVDEKINEKRDYQAEIEKINEGIRRAQEEANEKLKEQLDEIKRKIKEEQDRVVAAGKSVQEAADILREAQEDFNARLQQERERKEKELLEIVQKEEAKVKELKKRHVERESKKESIEQVNLQQDEIEKEEENYDRGLPNIDDEKFEPNGRALAFTMEGVPKMRFENGEEKEYTGPSNALSGGISQGNWTGVIPNANKPPVNLLDNYYMAYHIENQEDEVLAKGRLVKRIQFAINNKNISEKNGVEFRIALLTLKHLKEYNNIFGLEISNAFMQNGLGAIIRDQVYENISAPLRNGALPNSFTLDDNVDLNFKIDSDGKKNLKRAIDVAFAGGDIMMAKKFQRVQAEFNDMERVAKEYLGAAEEYKKSKSISSNIDRLTLEGLIETEQKEEAFAKLLISILNKPLIQIL